MKLLRAFNMQFFFCEITNVDYHVTFSYQLHPYYTIYTNIVVCFIIFIIVLKMFVHI